MRRPVGGINEIVKAFNIRHFGDIIGRGLHFVNFVLFQLTMYELLHLLE